MDVNLVAKQLRIFADERDWHKFHTPKNLAMALVGEAAELSEIFQWLTADESSRIMERVEQAEQVRDELADVMSYCIRLADILGVDLGEAISKKIAKNAAKYPVDLAKGRAAKYTELGK